MKENLYRGRSIGPSDLEPFYSEHIAAMTAEALHSKADIAEELAFRDSEIARLTSEVKALRHQMSRMVFDQRELGWD